MCFWRVLMRTLERVFTGKPLWHGNRETFGRAFLSRDSLLLYVLKTYHRRRREYIELFDLARKPKFRVEILKNPREIQSFLDLLIS